MHMRLSGVTIKGVKECFIARQLFRSGESEYSVHGASASRGVADLIVEAGVDHGAGTLVKHIRLNLTAGNGIAIGLHV